MPLIERFYRNFLAIHIMCARTHTPNLKSKAWPLLRNEMLNFGIILDDEHQKNWPIDYRQTNTKESMKRLQAHLKQVSIRSRLRVKSDLSPLQAYFVCVSYRS